MMCTIYRVHPTGVGMIRGGRQLHRQINRSSHRRGNDSLSIYVIMYWQEFIPQAWEWFGRGAAERTLDGVHPTGVGMIRCITVPCWRSMGSSHRRGNDSTGCKTTRMTATFIPQAWEWFGKTGLYLWPDDVHPTGVGMIRSTSAVCTGRLSSSHRRGNDSWRGAAKPLFFKFIPQAWEWFVVSE